MLDDDRVGDRQERPPQPSACPYLGLPDDDQTRFSFADPAHRCRAKGKPVPIDLGHQGALCLTAAYTGCKRYEGSASAKATPPIEVPLASVSGRITALPGPGTDGTRVGGRGRRSKVVRRVAILPILVTLVMVAGTLGTIAIMGIVGAVDAPSSTPTASATTASSPTPTPTPTPTPSPAPTPTPTQSPIPGPSPSPGAETVIHVVVRGENLTSIAAQYGVSPKSIQIANKIANPSLIFVGQKLVIPRAP